MLRSGRVVNKEQLASQLYGWDEEVGANAIEVYVHRLRKKVESSGVTIRTIRGLGYLLMNGIGLHNVELIMAVTFIIIVFAASVTTGGATGVTAVPVSAEFPASSSAVSV